nr:hypothetical protein [Tanacetum cinerariifolium]
MLVPRQVADDVADDVHAADAEPTPPSPTTDITPPPPQQEVASTPPQSPHQPTQQQQASSPPPQQPPLHDAVISIDLLNTWLETCTSLTKKVEALEQDKVAQAIEIIKLKQRVRKLEKRNKVKILGGIIVDLDADKNVTLEDVAAKEVNAAKDAEIAKNAAIHGRQEESQAKVYHIELEHADKVLKVVTATTTVAASTITPAPSVARRRKWVVIKDLEETATPSTMVHSELKSKDKGKGILVEEPKPLKKKA